MIHSQPTARTTPDRWGADNRAYPPTSGKPGPRDPGLTPYILAFERAFAAGGAYRRVVLVTGAQSGKTDGFLDVIGERLDTRPAPVIYVGPNKEFLTDQLEPRLMALFDEAATLKAKVARGKKMKKTLKRVAGVTVRLAHAGSSTALKSDPAALALVDEYDEMLANIKGQGDPLGLVEARGITYADFVTGVASTPSQGLVDVETDPVSGLQMWARAEAEEVASPIWRLWQEGTRYHWAWPCPQCGDYFIPRFKQLRWPKTATPAQARRAAFIECPADGCGGVIEESHKEAMNAAGVYVAPGQTVDRAGVVHGDPPDTSTLSFWVSGLASPFVTFGERAEAYLKAAQSGERDKIQTAVNAGFGEVFAPGGGDVPEWQEVMDLKLPFRRRQIPEKVVCLTAGVDVQGNRLPYVIRGWGARAESWLIDYGEIFGDTSETEVWEDLADLLTDTIDELPIRMAFVDSGFRPGKKFKVPEHRVYQFCRRFPRFVFATKGRDRQAKPLVKTTVELKRNGKDRGKPDAAGLSMFWLDTDHWKSFVHERLRYPADEAGAFHLNEDVEQDYCEQIVSEARVVAPGGKPKWVQRTRDNHYLDCEAMAAAAGYLVGVQRLGDRAARRRTGEDDAPHEVVTPDSPAAAIVAAKPKFDRFAKFAAGFKD